MIHAVKITHQYFEDAISGNKPFEVRKRDRDYRVGDYLALNEYDPELDGRPEWQYTGRSALFCITYVLNDPAYCKDGYIVLGIKPISMCGATNGAVPIIWGSPRSKEDGLQGGF